MPDKPVLAGLRQNELKDLLASYPPFRSAQIHKWILRGAESFEEMSSLPLSMRKELAESYILFPGEVSSELRDRDGTIKLGIKLEDGAVIETVMLRDGSNGKIQQKKIEGKTVRKTACLSSQAGCPLACVFCKTGALGYNRNLTAQEICVQFLQLRKLEPDISHIVVMGMGEPLLNMEEVAKALDFFMDPEGLGISKRRVTLSTSGIVKGIQDLAERGPDVRLALSLTTAREELRCRLMPVSRDNPLISVKEALLEYQKKVDRRITLEIVLLGGINTGKEDALAAADFSIGLNAVFNLIPWNPINSLEFENVSLRAPTPSETAGFIAALENLGAKVTLRTGKGCGISGACGQLGVV
ncbi:MAG: 23S rRNA (adenine(2503)-C(2))-methyltransferase RlmN [Treponema sp.]|jgi:23S rRNA (adenine2503-C2)-methyltransferase|nr:23S rRNA (adenine(2503)-C(2))-methyltransferase RlmN [Treponema sp.]